MRCWDTSRARIWQTPSAELHPGKFPNLSRNGRPEFDEKESGRHKTGPADQSEAR